MSDMPLPAAQAYRSVDVHGLRVGQPYEGRDCVAEEVPVAFEFNGVSHAVMMATPADLEDFAVGFSVTEGIVETAAQIYDCEWTSSQLGYTLHLQIAASCFESLKQRRRSLTGRTGCGLCGAESLVHAVHQPAVLAVAPCFDAAAVAHAVDSLRAHQTLLAATGATHAAAWCTAHGDIAVLREDVGRHNALDKLVGALVREGRSAEAGFITITSRASYEMVQKTVAAGVGLLAAVSGVTGLAVQVAQDAGLTLAGFARGENLSIYSHHERLTRNNK
jgi:formate dehydrogenase accessory protein FdhD